MKTVMTTAALVLGCMVGVFLALGEPVEAQSSAPLREINYYPSDFVWFDDITMHPYRLYLPILRRYP